MAKYECALRGNFDELLYVIQNGILSGSMSASLEDGSDYAGAGFRCAVRVFERYSVIGSNRVSLSLTVVENGPELYVSAITAGGSQAMFLKINTLGEEAFLDCLIPIVESYKNAH